MLSNIVNPIALTFTIVTAFGVLAHDTQLDKAATIAVAMPAALVSYAAIEGIKSSDGHVHVERASAPKNMTIMSLTLPRLQPRDDDRKLHQAKRVVYTSGDNGLSLWPSV